MESRGQHVGEPISWARVELQLNYPLLARLQEHVVGQVIVEVVDASTGEVLTECRKQLTILAPNQWQFEADYHEVLAAFVFPNDPYTQEILSAARQLLQLRTGDSSTEGYQSETAPDPSDPRPPQERSRAHQIAHAIYDAMSSMGYSYSNPPNLFTHDAQRVRTPAQVKQENCATCLDSSVLMAACLAQAGLEPVLFLTRGHAFAGFFTGAPVTDPAGQLVLGRNGKPIVGDAAVQFWTDRVAKSVLRRAEDYGAIQLLLRAGHLRAVETTSTTTGLHRPFHEACLTQNNFSVQDDSLLESIILVANAWRGGITPPVALLDVPLHGFHPKDVPQEPDDRDPLSHSSTAFGADDNLNGFDERQPNNEDRLTPPRVRQWMASLLDLSSRNPLLKIKPNQLLEFLVPAKHLGKVDDLLYTPKKRIELVSPAALPFEWLVQGVDEGKFTAWMDQQVRLVSPPYTELNGVQRQIDQWVRMLRGQPGDPISGVSPGDRRFIESVRADPTHAIHRQSDAELITAQRTAGLESLNARLTASVSKVQTKAKEVMLATGNNSLYLAIGTMAWTESGDFRGSRRSVDWCAPLYFHPVILEGGKGSPYTLRLDPNGEATPNYCLHEKLKRPPYNLDLQALVNPVFDKYGLDFNAMVGAIEKRLREAKFDNFAIQPRLLLGVFDYSTFRLWKDYKDSWREMSEISAAARHLMITPNVPFADGPPIPDPRLEPYLPIAADDSQRDAVQWALDGRSFRLEGPPGTGKSQTITNLLASCIANNKKVLFVAEKQTALNAVKDRLDECGLGNYCLNLHAKGDSDTRLRKNISEALTTALAQKIDPQDQKWQDLAFRVRTDEEILNRYRDTLHTATPGQPSVWNANEQLLDIGDGPTLEVPDSFVEDFEQRWPDFQRIASRIEQALELTGEPEENPWRLFTATTAGEEQFPLISEALDAVLAAHAALNDRGSEWSVLFGTMDVTTSSALSAAVALRLDGLLDNLDVVKRLTAPAQLVASGTGSDQPLRAFLLRCDELRDRVVPHLSAVASDFMDAGNAAEVAAVLGTLDSLPTSPAFTALSAAWGELASRVGNLHDDLVTGLLTRPDLHVVVEALAAYESQDARREFETFLADAVAFEAEVRPHLTNVSGSLLARNDLLNLGVLEQDAANAGLLRKGAKFKTLRAALGEDALTADDRFLQLSLTAMLRLAPGAAELRRRIQSRFPDLYTPEFRPWVLADIEALPVGLQRQRFDQLQRAVAAPTAPDNEARFVQAVRVILGVAPSVTTCRELLASSFPSVPAHAFRPWQATELTRLRQTLQSSQLSRLRDLLGSYALTPDDERLLAGVRALQLAAGTLTELRTAARAELVPWADPRLRPWHADDLAALTESRDKLVRLGRLLADSRWSAAVETILNGELREEDTNLLPLATAAWQRLDEVLIGTDESRAQWLAGRPLTRAVLDDFPGLRRDGGDRHRYLGLKRWLELLAGLDELEGVGLSTLRSDFLQPGVSVDEVVSRVRRSTIMAALDSRLRAGNLDRFDRKVHDRRIQSFEKTLAEAKTLLKVRIPGLVSERRVARALPTGNDLGATQLLLRGLKPVRGEKTPIRDLVSKYGSALAEAMPCFLMSPDSVATLLPVGSIVFDVVIFDEASQVRTSHAVGALGRGKAGIVVGDSRQMPPSTTFSSNSGAYVEDDEVDEDPVEADDSADADADGSVEQLFRAAAARDAESILSEYDDSSFPHLQLLCHYRSKDELLIAFSNTHIYETPMLTFPSVRGLESTALRFVHVQDGFFQRDKSAPAFSFKNTPVAVSSLRTNSREAEEVVEELVTRLRDPQRRRRREADPEKKAESIIVVTFNLQQMKLIDAMLREVDPDLYDEAVTEGEPDEVTGKRTPARLKIRNLENVQGDEAEAVIFSVAFTKTLAGTFPLNWGPVTQPGGERRLNVAVTRAQREMIVFASFLPQDMSAGNKTLSEMALMVQRFLTLAYRGPGHVGDVGIEVIRSRHIEAIAQALRDRGYVAQTQLGLSNLRVDIAAKRQGSAVWELAIMIDDAGWFGRGSAFQREVLPRQILPGLGWKRVLRVWLPSWLNERDELLAEVESILSSTEPPIVDDHADEALPAPLAPLQAAPQTGRPRLSLSTSSPAEPLVRAEQTFTEFLAFDPAILGSIDDLDLAGANAAARRKIVEILDRVIATEGPVEANRLAKLVGYSLGLGRVSNDRVQQILALLPKNQLLKDPLGTYAWPTALDRETWRGYRTSLDPSELPRTPTEISAYEYANALEDLVMRAHVIEQGDAIREVARTFGFKRLTANARDAVEKALAFAVRQGRVDLVDGEYRPRPS